MRLKAAPLCTHQSPDKGWLAERINLEVYVRGGNQQIILKKQEVCRLSRKSLAPWWLVLLLNTGLVTFNKRILSITSNIVLVLWDFLITGGQVR